jgi:mRNA interferase MazF
MFSWTATHPPDSLRRRRVDIVIRCFDVYLVSLGPTVGSEIRKTRPCLIVSPDEMNRYIGAVIVAPMTTQGRAYPRRIPCRLKGKAGQVVLDQPRTVDRIRLARKLGRLDRTAFTIRRRRWFSARLVAPPGDRSVRRGPSCPHPESTRPGSGSFTTRS